MTEAMNKNGFARGASVPCRVLFRGLIVAALGACFAGPAWGRWSAPLQDVAPQVANAPAPDDDANAIEVQRDGDLPGDRAWEFAHYRVRVWICSDGSSLAESYVANLPGDLVRLSRLTDASAWELLPGPAPADWRWAALNGIADGHAGLDAIGQSPLLQHDNKLMLVTLRHESGGLLCQVRELDLTTNQWGALLSQPVLEREAAADTVFGMVRTAFMPLARIDRVSEKNEVWLRVRAANLCQRVRFDPSSSAWTVEPNTGSPARIRPNDVFLPVLRRTDRDNKLVSQEPVEFTFVTINPAGPPKDDEPAPGTAGGADAPAPQPAGEPAAPVSPDAAAKSPQAGEQPEAASGGNSADNGPAVSRGPDAPPETVSSAVAAAPVDAAALFGQVHSTFRAPLVARRSKRLEKLALVIRPPASATSLKLVSADKPDQPMEGVEIWSRPLDAVKDEASEFIGKTDWRGLIDIPPSADGLRVIYVKRGARSLMKLPVMPGFHPQQTSTMVNDEARLFAEGVIAGMGNEILDVVAQREIFQKLINDYLASDNPETRAKAVGELEKYEALPKPQAIRARLTDEKSRLLALSKDRREAGFVTGMFENLEKVLSQFLAQSRETELRQKIQDMSLGVPPSAPSTGPEAGSEDGAAADAPVADPPPAEDSSSAETPAPEGDPPAPSGGQ